jgi:hypothetical protein
MRRKKGQNPDKKISVNRTKARRKKERKRSEEIKTRLKQKEMGKTSAGRYGQKEICMTQA